MNSELKHSAELSTTFKKILWVLIILATAGTQVFAQLGTRRIETTEFYKNVGNPDCYYVDMNFNKAEMETALDRVPIDRIQSISLVYTQYKLSDRFNQLELNTQRIDRLLKAYPKLKSKKDIQWYWIAQTGCDNPGDCRSFFHGFEIKLKSEEAIARADLESDLLDHYIDMYSKGEESSDKLDSLIATGTTPIVKQCDTTYREIRFAQGKYGTVKNLHQKSQQRFLRKLRFKGIETDDVIIVDVNHRSRIEAVHGATGRDSLRLAKLMEKNFKFRASRYRGKRTPTRYYVDLKGPDRKPTSMDIASVPVDENWERIDSFEVTSKVERSIHCYYIDSTRLGLGYAHESVVTEVLDRNSQWKNCLVVTDVTGSMYPYLGQFLAWHKLHLMSNSTNNNFVFFNDGDQLCDMLKQPGEVGGTYFVQTTEYQKLKEKLDIARYAGNGGDAPENNVEATLYGIEKNPRVKEVIMIADNWATPRDLELLNKIKKPIHIILCGTSSGVNVQYLNMARKNGGSIHTIEDDLTRLAKMSEGEKITILGTEYVIRNGEFQTVPAITAAED